MRKDNEDAVSPVVGVMLMLVITVVIAAVVSVFATGLITSSEPSSNVVISLSDHKLTQVGDDYQFSTMTFTHKGGDVLDMSNLKLALAYGGDTYTFFMGDLWSQYPEEIDMMMDGAEFQDLRNWEPGEKLTLDLFSEMYSSPDEFGYSSLDDAWSKMNPKGSFSWSIIDVTGYTIATGTADVL